MSLRRRPIVRLGRTAAEETAAPRAVLANPPSLPVVDFASIGQSNPGLPQTPSGIPAADAVVVCWAEAEWAALQHVFVGGGQPMPYAEASRSSWPGWRQFSKGIPAGGSRDPTYWGDCRLVTVGPKSVLLFKSNVHLDESQSLLEQLVGLLIQEANPRLILSTGTAGGARATAPAVNDLTPATSLLTATSFVVANTSGNYGDFACVEMDDAVIGKVCSAHDVPFGFVRNISDPIQNQVLPPSLQGAWGSFLYDAYGFYTSYNGALAAWGVLSAMA